MKNTHHCCRKRLSFLRPHIIIPNLLFLQILNIYGIFNIISSKGLRIKLPWDEGNYHNCDDELETEKMLEKEVELYNGVEEGRNIGFVDLLDKLRDDFFAIAVEMATDIPETKLSNLTYCQNTSSVAHSIQHTLAKPPQNQHIDFRDPFLLPPKFDAANTTTLILVPSHQGSFVKRQAIRQMWMASAKRSATTTVLFVVAQSDCKEFDSDLSANAAQSTSNHSTSPTCEQIDHNFLKLEQRRNHDLLEIPMKEEYRRLPEKMMQAYNWAVRNMPNLKWVAKADDDMFVDVQNLETYVRKYNPDIPIVMGEIIYDAPVVRSGKWAEFDFYEKTHYPNWPKGSAGHVLSRGTLNYLIENFESLLRYQGEDVSIGIWLDEAQKIGRLKDLTWIHTSQNFVSTGPSLCSVPKDLNVVMIGHDLSPDDQKLCHEAALKSGGFKNGWKIKNQISL